MKFSLQHYILLNPIIKCIDPASHSGGWDEGFLEVSGVLKNAVQKLWKQPQIIIFWNE